MCRKWFKGNQAKPRYIFPSWKSVLVGGTDPVPWVSRIIFLGAPAICRLATWNDVAFSTITYCFAPAGQSELMDRIGSDSAWRSRRIPSWPEQVMMWWPCPVWVCLICSTMRQSIYSTSWPHGDQGTGYILGPSKEKTVCRWVWV